MLCRAEEETEQSPFTSSEGTALGTQCPRGSYDQESDTFVRPWNDHPMEIKTDILRPTNNYFRSVGDSGLFYACYESRYIILKHLETLTPGKPVTLAARHDGEDIQLLFNAETDVIKLEFTPEYLATCQTLSWDDFRARTPFLRQPANKVSIAFDFDWLQSFKWNRREALGRSQNSESELRFDSCFQEQTLIGIIVRAVRAWAIGELPEDTNIWLIDREGTSPIEYPLEYLERRYSRSIGKVLLADERYDYVAGIGYGMDRFIRLLR